MQLRRERLRRLLGCVDSGIFALSSTKVIITLCTRNLAKVLVKQDDVIDASTIVGYPGFDPERESYGIHFEVWSGKEKQDPIAWLAPAKK